MKNKSNRNTVDVTYLPTYHTYLPYDHGDTVQTIAPTLRYGIKLDWAPNIRITLSTRDMDS
jgi:hypothetical protein